MKVKITPTGANASIAPAPTAAIASVAKSK